MNYILLLLLVLFSGCTITIEQTVSSEPEIPTILTITDTTIPDKDYCQEFQQYFSYPIQSCEQTESKIRIYFLYYPNEEEFSIKESLFSTTYHYDPSSLNILLNEGKKYLNTNSSIDKTTVTITSDISFADENYEHTDNTITIPIEKATKEVTFKQLHYPYILGSVFGLFLLVFLIYLVAKEPNVTINPREIQAKQYILTYKNQYPKQALFQGLIQNGYSPQEAETYITKYY
jgi:hypothetical protein